MRQITVKTDGYSLLANIKKHSISGWDIEYLYTKLDGVGDITWFECGRKIRVCLDIENELRSLSRTEV